MRTLLFTAIPLAFLIACFASVSIAADPARVTAEELKAMMERGERVVLIDVRTPQEHAESHIPGSVLMPLDTLEKAESLPEDGQMILYCRSGKRSQTARGILGWKGYKGIRDLDGGINAWIKAGGETVSGPGK
ncbi:MAG: rhodanese-like domain-containing protein [Deltaproteobacteria bacterium]|nr:rhodanese-like domain-containing protein [Deltaproteobacteria bacterium]MCL4873764.1 rhodanese-like domain-containing protein [bacterium]